MATPRGYSGGNPSQHSLFYESPEALINRQEEWDKKIAHETALKARRAEKIRKQISMFVVQAHKQGFHWTTDQKLLEYLDLPLGHYEPSDLDVQPAIEAENAEAEAEASDAFKTHDTLADLMRRVTFYANVDKWSDDAVTALHERVLHYSLALLTSKGNAEEKRETLEWIWSNDVFEFVPVFIKGRLTRIPLREDQFPFTFQTCCSLSGLDYEDLRAGLAWTLRDVLPKLGFAPRKDL